MRDQRFKAVHRGGPLKKEHHQLLTEWACQCAENVLPLCDHKTDERLKSAIIVARQWIVGKATTGDARKASLTVLSVAREHSNQVSIAAARAVAHAVATAHMADHSLTAANYALKTVKFACKQVVAEREWQIEQLPEEIAELVLTAAIKHKPS